MKQLLLILCCSLLSPTLVAAENIAVRGLFSGKALIEVDGKSRVMREGERSTEGVLLIHADSKYAEIEFNGQRQKLTLGGSISSKFSVARKREVTIPRGEDGMYRIGGAINGRGVQFLVDTGASLLAMNNRLAQRLGIHYLRDGRKGLAETASGIVPAYSVFLDKVEVGMIVLTNVEATIIEGAQPSKPLLGLSFLRRVDLAQTGNIITLTK